MPPAWTMNGAIYLLRTALLFAAEPGLYGDRTAAYVMPPASGISIDSLDGLGRRGAGPRKQLVTNTWVGPIMDIEAHRDLKLLEAVEQDSRVTQRSLATKLGIALGLTNIYLKRLVRKGYIKCVNVQSNRITYLITPRGIAEKARLTYEFMDYSLHLYGEVRQHLRDRPAGVRGGRPAGGDLRTRRGRGARVSVAAGSSASSRSRSSTTTTASSFSACPCGRSPSTTRWRTI